MGLLTFSAEERQPHEPTPAECEALRVHNRMERASSTGEYTSIKTELAEVTAQMGKVSEIREVERAIPRVQFATDICHTKLSLDMKYIVAKLTSETYAEIQTSNSTCDSWYQRLRTTTNFLIHFRM